METKKRGKKKEGVVHLGLIYDVERQRFDIVCKDFVTNVIRIGPSDNKEAQEVHTSISAA